MHFKGRLIGMTRDVLAGEREQVVGEWTIFHIERFHIRSLHREKSSAFHLDPCGDICSVGSQSDRSEIASL